MELFKSLADPAASKTPNTSVRHGSSYAVSQQHEKRSVNSGHTSARKPSTYGRSNSKHSISATREPNYEDSRSTNIRVFARFRPMNRLEAQLTNNGFGEVGVQFLSDTSVALDDGSGSVYSFDQVLPPGTTQKEMFEAAASRTVQDVLNGYNGTIIAYGQTGSGKTYTMVGDAHSTQLKGIIPRSISEIFGYVAKEDAETEFKLTCSILEIYRQNLYDLLSEHRDLKIKESPSRGVFVEGLTEFTISTQRELYNVLEIGEQTRRIASTRLNENSSRSHTLFILDVRQLLSNKNEKFGRLNLVDLAGSEKVAKTGAVGELLEQAKKINFSLSCLGNVIHALTNKNDYIPYRDSKLTRILSESIGGNYRTSLIVTCSSHSSSFDETVSTLKFATRAKSIKNTCRVNIKNSPQEMQKIIAQLRTQIVELKLQLQVGDRSAAVVRDTEPDESHEQAHQTVRNTSRLRMIKNPFQRPAMNVSTIQPPESTTRDQLESAFRGSEHLAVHSETQADMQLAKQVGRLKVQLNHQKVLSRYLRQQLSEVNRCNSISYRQEVRKATESERLRIQELCMTLEGVALSKCSTPLKDASFVRMTPRKASETGAESRFLRVIQTFPQDLQNLYLSLQDYHRDTVAQLRNCLQYIEAVKQNVPEHISSYLHACLSQQTDRSSKSQQLVENLIMKEAIKHNLTSLELLQNRSSLSKVIEQAYLEQISRNERLAEALEKRIHERTGRGISLLESHHAEHAEQSETMRLIDSDIQTEQSVIRIYEQNYETLHAQIDKLREVIRSLEHGVQQHLIVMGRPSISTPPPTMKNDCSSPLKQDFNRANMPKTPPKQGASRSGSMCKQLLVQSDILNRQRSTAKTPLGLLSQQHPIQFRYQHYYA